MPKRVIVAGAGLAGLSAAYELLQSGHDVTILEASHEPGGRVHTLRSHFADGMHADAGAIFIPSIHPLPMQYANQFNLTLQHVQAEAANHLFFVAGQRVLITPSAPPQWPAALQLKPDEVSLTPQQLVSKYTASLVGKLSNPQEPHWPPEQLRHLDGVSFGQLLRDHGASEAAVNLMGLQYFNLWGDGLESYSALFALRDEALERGNTGSSLIEGGNDKLPRAFAAALKGHIWYGAEVTSIHQDATGVQVAARRAGIETTFSADFAVCAVPFAVTRRISFSPALSVLKQQAIVQLPYTSVVRIFLQFRERFWLQEGLTGAAFTDLPIMSVYPAFDSPGQRGILSCYVAGPNARMISSMNEPARIQFALNHMEMFYPQVRDYFETGVTVCWSSRVGNCGGYVYCRPGQVFAFQPTLSAPEGRIHFAGDHTSAWPGWMQGALDSGQRCATEINQIV